ncbi:MAG TPA: glutathione transferase GstA [Stellaceae bacterium]|nr:glutathione transferase GstA [Stellaceae bacterium]
MKLYFAPGASSLTPHIALREAGLAFELEQVDHRQKKTKDGGDYRSINPKGQVPALRLDDGQILTEAAVVVQYIADQKPAAKLAPPAGGMARYRLQEWLNFIASEMHKEVGALFDRNASNESKAQQKEMLVPKFEYLAQALAGRDYLMGDQFTVADGYLYNILRWARLNKIDLARWPALAAFMQRVEARPAVQAALKAEGLIK